MRRLESRGERNRYEEPLRPVIAIATVIRILTVRVTVAVIVILTVAVIVTMIMILLRYEEPRRP